MAMARVGGGLMRVVETLAAEQARRHEVTVLAPLGPRPVGGAPAPAWRALRLRGNADLPGHLALARALRRARPEVVILHAGSPGELALAAALASLSAPAIIVEHAPDVYPLRRARRDRVLAWLKRRSRYHVCVSGAGAGTLARLWRLPPGRLTSIHSGVPRPTTGGGAGDGGGVRSAGDLVVGFGAPTREKGFDTFEAVARALSARAPALRFAWIGGASSHREGACEVQAWRDGIAEELSRAAVVALPSRAEGLPLTLLEAMACGAAIVASDVGGIPEAVENGREAVLVPPDDAVAWSAAVSSLLDDPARREALGRAARRRWETEFTAEAMAARWEALLETVWR